MQVLSKFLYFLLHFTASKVHGQFLNEDAMLVKIKHHPLIERAKQSSSETDRYVVDLIAGLEVLAR